MRSKKLATPPPPSATAAPAGQPWRVKLHPDVAATVAQYAAAPATFRPTLLAVIDALKSEPTQFPKKVGKLKGARAASLRFGGRDSWRLVFTIDEHGRTVNVLALAKHDTAYAIAQRRV